MKSILITGATSGIGEALAIDYAKDSLVIACGRNNDKLIELEKTNNITSLSFDVTKIEDIKNKTDALPSVDVLILNAGTCEYVNDANSFDSALFERIIKANLLSVGYCLEVLLPKLNAGGQLVIVSSSASFLPLPRAQAYGASKAALTYLGYTMALDLKNIGVTVVHPGFVKTPLTDKNDFPMPFAVSTEFAVKKIRKGITQKKKEIHFPRIFTYILKLLRLLPFPVWSKVIKGISN